MRVFLTRQVDTNEELYSQVGRVQSELVVARIAATDTEKAMRGLQEETQAAKSEACQMGEKKDAAEAKCKGVEQKSDQLKKELEDFWATSEAQKKQLEELQVKFTTEKEVLTKDYQKQVDEMFFFGYQCCLRKNNITQDIPTYPSNDEEDATVSGPILGDKDPYAPSPFTRQ